MNRIDMAPACGRCGESVDTLRQQVSVMRREMKNMRQMLDSAVRAHRKQQASIRAAVSEIGIRGDQTPPPPSIPAQASLEQGNIQTVPIGYISSCFSEKNGTPRQPTICGPSRAELRLQQSVFNNPDHALLGLDQYSHVWIIFLFHKNGHLSCKAKVKPPRLNGQRVGVYSTRSPHRPNALGLTLAKLDRVVGDTLHLSDIDMIAGTPVLDIKPYIPEYDSPRTRSRVEPCDLNAHQPDVSDGEESNVLNLPAASGTHAQSDPRGERTDCDSRSQVSEEDRCGRNVPLTPGGRDLHRVLQELRAFVDQGDLCQSQEEVSESAMKKPSEPTVDHPCYGEEAASTVADWIRAPPVCSLEVRFTPQAERELAQFLPAHQSGASEGEGPRFKFLRSTEEATAAIRGVLLADPRSVYRRTRCRDKLFFFTLDTADVTCWFGLGFAEVLQVRAVESQDNRDTAAFTENMPSN